MNHELEQLERALKTLQKPSINSDVQERIKGRLFSEIQKVPHVAELRLASRIREVARTIIPSLYVRARIKEKVLSFAEKTSQKYGFSFSYFKLSTRAIATFMITVLLGGTFAVYISDIPVTHAAKNTKLLEVHGAVEIIRNNKNIAAEDEMELEEGDVIKTGQSGIAVVRYVDDSISRLSPETEVKINKLFQDENNVARTIVDIELIEGRVWNNVINLISDESSFQVKADDITAVTSDKATFDIVSEKGASKVAVYDNKVKVTIEENPIIEDESLLLEGYSLETNEDKQKIEKIDSNDKVGEGVAWVKVNEEKDKEYVKTIEDEKEQEMKNKAGLLPEDPLYTAKKINESAKLLVTIDEDAKDEIKLEIAEKRLLEAIALLANGNEEGASELLDEYKEIIADISDNLKDNEELHDFAMTLIEENLKNLAVVTPESDLYPAKEALREAQQNLTTETTEKQQVILEQASEILLEAKDLVEQDKEDIALEVVSELQEDVEEANEEAAAALEEPTTDTATEEPVDEVIIENLLDAEVNSQASAEILLDAIEENPDAVDSYLEVVVEEITVELKETTDVETVPEEILIIDVTEAPSLTNTETQ